MTPQMMDAVPKTCVDGQMNLCSWRQSGDTCVASEAYPFGWSAEHMSGMFVNIHA